MGSHWPLDLFTYTQLKSLYTDRCIMDRQGRSCNSRHVLAICCIHCHGRKPILLGFQSHREIRQRRHRLMDAATTHTQLILQQLHCNQAIHNAKYTPVVAVEVLVDANFAGRVLLDLVMKILHRSANRRASAQPSTNNASNLNETSQQVKKFRDGWIARCLETGGAAWKASATSLLSLSNSSADCNAATAILWDFSVLPSSRMRP